MNLPARNQNPIPSETETQGESPAKPAPNAAIPSVKKVQENAPEAKAEAKPKAEELAIEPAHLTAIRIAPQCILQEVAPGLKIPPILLEGDEPAPRPPSESTPKFALELAPVTPASQPEKAILPEAYGTGRIWLAARDPHCLYVHWDLTSEQQRHYSALAAGHHLVIRVRLEAPQDRGVIEVKLPSDSRHCFIQVTFAGRRYLAELGYYQEDQRWNSIAVSESASTPPEGITHDKTARFATISIRNLLPQQTAPAKPPWTAESPEKTQTQPQTEPARAQNVQEYGSLPNTLSLSPEPKPHARPVLRPWSESNISAQIAPPESFEADVAPISDWTLAQEEALAEIIDWRLTGSELPSSAEMIELQQPSVPLGPSAGISSLPMLEEISSLAGGQVPRQEGFWLSVNAELVIYGATDPNAHITIGGHPIHLWPDGTFSYRFALPDGRYELPIVAVAAQGDLRRAHLEFYRGTKYEGEVLEHPQDPDLKKPDAGNVS